MPHTQCSRCFRNEFTVPIGIVILIYPAIKGIEGSDYRRVNVCTTHMNTIGEWLNLSMKPHMKLPRTTLDKDKQTHLTPYFSSEQTFETPS